MLNVDSYTPQCFLTTTLSWQSSPQCFLTTPLSWQSTPQCFLTTTLSWQSVVQRIKYQYCLLVFKIMKNIVPPYLGRLITPYSVTYSTRYADNCSLLIPHPKTEYKTRSFSFTGSLLFNKLPIAVQRSSSLQTFKTSCLKCSAMLY